MTRRPAHHRSLALLALWLLAGWCLAQETHRVEPGDTLSAVARRYGTTVEALRRLNGLEGDLLRVGQRLELPVQGGYRTVRAGGDEGWDELAARFGRSVATLRSANPEVSAPAGRSVRIPPGEGVTVWARPGDEPLTLAARFAVAPGTLIRLNGWRAPYRLAEGEPVLIPQDAVGFGEAAQPPSSEAAGRAAQASAAGGAAEPSRGGSAREAHRRAQAAALARFGVLADRLEPPEDGLRWPLAGRLSSRFGWRNVSVNGNRYHQGIDLAAAPGMPVLAAASGTVSRAGWVGAYGFAVYVDHGDALQTRYAHLSRIDVRVGERVERGGELGAVGSSGASTGPHLHFEIRIAGRAVDPLLHLPKRMAGAEAR